MKPLSRDDLLSLEQYAEQRKDFREAVIKHKLNRRVEVGPNATLYFEDRLTIQYQIQEMLRIEKIFEASGIEEELETYNPLIPDGTNWKATFMIEYPDADERRVALIKLSGIEDRVWVKAGDSDRVWAIADEDLERATEEKTSAVHFLRFELPQSVIDAIKSGSEISMGISHDYYKHSVAPVPRNVHDSLINDLD